MVSTCQKVKTVAELFVFGLGLYLTDYVFDLLNFWKQCFEEGNVWWGSLIFAATLVPHVLGCANEVAEMMKIREEHLQLYVKLYHSNSDKAEEIEYLLDEGFIKPKPSSDVTNSTNLKEDYDIVDNATVTRLEMFRYLKR